MEVKEIIDNIHNINFYNISYREYYGLIDEYVVEVFPFVTEIKKMHKAIENFSENRHFNHLEKIARFHQIDYDDNKCSFQPCLIYEKISGYPIHTKPELEDNFGFPKEYYIKNAINFDKKIIQHIRKQKLKKLNFNI